MASTSVDSAAARPMMKSAVACDISPGMGVSCPAATTASPAPFSISSTLMSMPTRLARENSPKSPTASRPRATSWYRASAFMPASFRQEPDAAW